MPGWIIAIGEKMMVPQQFPLVVDPLGSSWQADPLSVYVHLPFCRVKCTYCAFAISTDSRLEQRYVSALVEEIRHRIRPDARLATLYFGGGTPSRLSIEGVRRLGEELARYAREDGAEITLEANPEDVNPAALDRWSRDLGVNRLSLGVQSFHEAELTPLGRGHGRQGALDAIELAAGSMARLSVDLMLGLPEQTVERVESSAEMAMTGPAGHLSLYLLDLEPGSALERRVHSGLIDLPPEDAVAEMYRAVIRLAGEHGLEQYEVSNFARPGQKAVHNCRYWTREPYVGVGLGAHSFDGTTRTSNTRNIREYVELIESGSLPVSFSEVLTEEEIRHERIFLGLRQTGGLPADELRELAGADAQEWMDEALEQGWVELESERVRFTVEGFLISDELMARLF